MGDWMSCGTDEPGDQQADLLPPYWAVIGPEGAGSAWSWAVLDSSRGEQHAAGGEVDDEAAAKAAVEKWERAQLARQAVCRHCGKTITTLVGNPIVWVDDDGLAGCVKGVLRVPGHPEDGGRVLVGSPVCHLPMPAGLNGAPQPLERV